jgi:hypothetical protein
MEIAGAEMWTFWSEMNKNHAFHFPKKSVSIILPANDWLLNLLATGDAGGFQALYSPVRSDAPKLNLWWRFALKLITDPTKNTFFFSAGI